MPLAAIDDLIADALRGVVVITAKTKTLFFLRHVRRSIDKGAVVKIGRLSIAARGGMHVRFGRRAGRAMHPAVGRGPDGAQRIGDDEEGAYGQTKTDKQQNHAEPLVYESTDRLT